MSELSPKAEARGMKLAATLSRCGLAALPGRFRSASGKTRLRSAAAGLFPSLPSKLPCAAILRASFSFPCCNFPPVSL